MQRDMNTQLPHPIYVEQIDSIPHQQLALEVGRLKESFGRSYLLYGNKVSEDLTNRNSFNLRDMKIVEPYTAQILSAVDLRWQQILLKLRLKPFPIRGRDLNCVAYNDGGFLKRHKDIIPQNLYPRRVTWIYYFFREPKAFTGGELVFFQGDSEITRVTPSSGLLVAFPSEIPHAATSVSVSDPSFENGRFSINCFVTSHPTFLGASRTLLHSLNHQLPVIQPVTRPVLKGLRRVLRSLKNQKR